MQRGGKICGESSFTLATCVVPTASPKLTDKSADRTDKLHAAKFADGFPWDHSFAHSAKISPINSRLQNSRVIKSDRAGWENPRAGPEIRGESPILPGRLGKSFSKSGARPGARDPNRSDFPSLQNAWPQR